MCSFALLILVASFVVCHSTIVGISSPKDLHVNPTCVDFNGSTVNDYYGCIGSSEDYILRWTNGFLGSYAASSISTCLFSRIIQIYDPKNPTQFLSKNTDALTYTTTTDAMILYANWRQGMFIKDGVPTYQTCTQRAPQPAEKPIAGFNVSNYMACALKCGDNVCNTFAFNTVTKRCLLYTAQHDCTNFVVDSRITTGYFNTIYNTGTRVFNEVVLKICNAVGFGPSPAFCYSPYANVALAVFDGCRAVNILGANIFQPTFPSWFEFLWTNYGVLVPKTVERQMIDRVSPARSQYQYDTGCLVDIWNPSMMSKYVPGCGGTLNTYNQTGCVKAFKDSLTAYCNVYSPTNGYAGSEKVSACALELTARLKTYRSDNVAMRATIRAFLQVCLGASPYHGFTGYTLGLPPAVSGVSKPNPISFVSEWMLTPESQVDLFTLQNFISIGVAV